MCFTYPIYEFILWDNCNNNCKFCFQAKKRNILTIAEKQRSIQIVQNKILANQQKCNILFVGGELFDSVELTQDFIRLFENVAKLQLANKVEYVYFNTNLLYQDLKLIFNVLDIFKSFNLLSKIKFTTSYDEYGRFESENAKKTFETNIKIIRAKYTNLNIIINSIMTKQMCLSLINGNTHLYNLTTQCQLVNLLPYVVCNKKIAATKNEIFEALIAMNKHQPGYIEKYIRNINLVQERKIFKYVEGKLVFMTEKNSSCGHCLNFRKYTDSGSCFICDINALFGDFI